MAKEDGLSKEVLEAVQRNLPEAMVGVLRAELAELTRLREVDTLFHTLSKKSEDQARSIKELNEELFAFKERERLLDLREQKVKETEIQLELILVKEQLKAVYESRSEIQKLAETVFRNKTLIETMTRLGDVPLWGGNGAIVGVQKPGGIETRTTTED